MFKDRYDAGMQLADALAEFRDSEDAVVIALPRGGVVCGHVIARELNLPLDVAMVKKLGHPSNPEYAIGAVSLTGRVLNGHKGVSEEYIEEATDSIRALLQKRYEFYYGQRKPLKLMGKTAIVVDDGVATGKTVLAALELLRKEKPAQIILAVSVGPVDTIQLLREYSDRVICLEEHENFFAIGAHFSDFSQVSDEEVKRLLQNTETIRQ